MRNSKDDICIWLQLMKTIGYLIVWRNGMCGLKDHGCKARMKVRQGRERATRQQNNQTTEYQQDIEIL
jgi:hypothetical protein